MAARTAVRLASAQKARDKAGNKTCACCGHLPPAGDRLVVIHGMKILVSHTTDRASGYFGARYYEVPR